MLPIVPRLPGARELFRVERRHVRQVGVRGLDALGKPIPTSQRRLGLGSVQVGEALLHAEVAQDPIPVLF